MTLYPRLLDSGMNEVRRLHPVSMALNEELHALSYATMVLPPGEEIAFHDWVKLYTVGGFAGIYRANKVDSDTSTGCQTVKLEHGICALADAVANVESEDVNGSVSTALTRILQYQTVQAGGADLWAVGTVEPSGSVSITLNYNSAMSLLTSLIDQLNECYTEYDQSALPWTVSVKQKGTAPTAEGRLGRNVASAKISYDDRDMANYIYCPKVQGGHMSDAASIAQYGRREGYCKVDDGVSPTQAAEICARYLAKRKDPAAAVSISMADLSAVTGEALDRIRPGKLYRLALPKYGVTVDETVESISWPDVMARPTEAKVSLANHAADLVLNIKKLGKGGGGGKQQNEIDKTIKRFETAIEKTDEYIALIATETDVETAQLLGKSVFRVAADAISAEVSRATGEEASIKLTLDGITIQGDVITIKGNQINMGDYVTVTNLQANYATITSLDALSASFNNLTSGATTASMLSTTLLQVAGSQYRNVPLSLGPISAGGFLGTANSSVSLDHYHGITVTESGGVVTITQGAAQLTAGSDSFNIADTQFYRSGVSAARAAGYSAGVNEFTPVTIYVATYGSRFYLNRFNQGSAIELYTWDGNPDSTPQSAGMHRWYWSTDLLSVGYYAPYSQVSGTYYTRD